MEKVREVPVPELGEEVYIRLLEARERDAYDNSINDGERRNIENISARLVALCLCDAEGAPMFGPQEGAAVIAKWPTPIVEPLFHECRKLNRMGKDAVEEAAKNFESDPGDSSSTDLQQPSG